MTTLNDLAERALDAMIALPDAEGSYADLARAAVKAVAAPEMLEALKALKDFAKAYIGRMDSEEIEQFELARAAIAKAEGRTP